MTDNASNYVRPEIWAIYVADSGRRDAALKAEAGAATRAGGSPDLLAIVEQRQSSDYAAEYVPEGTPEDTASRNAFLFLVNERVAAMDRARAEKDYATSDRIREALAELGVTVENRTGGSVWKLDRFRLLE